MRRCCWWGILTGAAFLPSFTALWHCWRNRSAAVVLRLAVCGLLDGSAGLVCGLLDAPCLNVSVPAAVELAAVKVERNAYGVAHFYGCVGGGHTVRAEDGQGNLLGVVLLSLNNVHAFLPGISGARSALLDGALLDDFSD